jgi:hypothetical protein
MGENQWINNIQNIQRAQKIKLLTNNPINKWANELNRQFSAVQVPN